jgi:hypothetical protein
VDLALLCARLLDVLSARCWSGSRAAVQVEDELLGQLRDGTREDDDVLAALVLEDKSA